VTSASGVGLATIAADGTVLDTWFPAPELTGDGPAGTVRLSEAEVPDDLGALAALDEDRGVETIVVRTVIAALDYPPADAHDAYLRLHLLSHRLIEPHGANMSGIFGVLANVAWTTRPAHPLEQLDAVRRTDLAVAESDLEQLRRLRPDSATARMEPQEYLDRTADAMQGREIWLRFATWILLALEFALAADLVRTAVAPTWDDISKLAVIATIRTMLNYFLAKDIMAFEQTRDDRAKTDMN